ncbi:shematrin-like protein 2 [Topomyia yanbarensis]|uniref:shematrin-like protein 2 n=1 Tax=Topomyia yanbarensis TaxID=2498891 RepID=UPI00273AFEFA|nr:shematrin-like protein 2 [Topomyia yanbarensis]
MNSVQCLMLLLVASTSFAFPQSEVVPATQGTASLQIAQEKLPEQQTADEQPVQVPEADPAIIPVDIALINEQPANVNENTARRKRQFGEIDIDIDLYGGGGGFGGPGYYGGYPGYGYGGYGGYVDYGYGYGGYGYPHHHHHHHGHHHGWY